jgi:LemA protein
MSILDWIIIAIIIVIIIIVLLWAVRSYNRFVRLKKASETTLAQTQVAMKKRLDMIGELVDAVKSYAQFEKDTLTKVTEMRASVGNAAPSALNKVEAETRPMLGNLFAVAENYPDLKTSTEVTNLMGAVRTNEDDIARQRYTFNNIAQEFNTRRETIPSSLIGRFMHLAPIDYLKFEEAIETPPTTTF